MTRSSLTGCGLALAAILLMADGAWGQSGSTPPPAPAWGKPAAATVPPAATAKPAAATGWATKGAAGTSAGQVSPALPSSQTTVRPAPATLGWATVKPGRPVSAVTCQISALNPGWRWTITNHTARTFAKSQFVTIKTHYPWANPNKPPNAFDGEARIDLESPLAPGASAVLLSVPSVLDPMTAPPTCTVESIGSYVQ